MFNSVQSILIRAESMSFKPQTSCAVSIETEGGTIKREYTIQYCFSLGDPHLQPASNKWYTRIIPPSVKNNSICLFKTLLTDNHKETLRD